MVGRHEWIRERLHAIDLPAHQRLPIEALLSTTADGLRAAPTLADFTGR
jgi:hypothetical protein